MLKLQIPRENRMNMHKNARLTPRGRERIVRQVATPSRRGIRCVRWRGQPEEFLSTTPSRAGRATAAAAAGILYLHDEPVDLVR